MLRSVCPRRQQLGPLPAAEALRLLAEAGPDRVKQPRDLSVREAFNHSAQIGVETTGPDQPRSSNSRTGAKASMPPRVNGAIQTWRWVIPSAA